MEIRLTVESLHGHHRSVMGTSQLLAMLHVLMSQREDLKARWPSRDTAELVVFSMSTLDPRFFQGRQEGWSFSQARARWESRKRVARFGAAMQTVDSSVRRDRAVQTFRLDDDRRRMRTSGEVGSGVEEDAQSDLGEQVKFPYTRRGKETMKTTDSRGFHDPAQFADVKLLVENQPKGSEEQLLGRRSRLLSSLGTTNSESVRSGLSEGVVKAARDSEFEEMDDVWR